MQKLSFFATFASLVLSVGVVPSFGGQGRVERDIADDGPRTAMMHTVSPRVLVAADLGAAPEEMVLRSITVRFSMTPAQNAALEQLMVDQQNSASPRYHHWLTPEEYATQFGLSSADIESVSGWLRAQGFSITGVARSHTFVTLSGTAAQVKHAFGTTVHTVSLNGEQHFANLSDPTLPSAIAGVVSGITGLNNFRLQPHMRAYTAASKPEFTSTVSGSHFIAPGDFATIYGLDPLLSSSIDGTGVTIAVLGQTDIDMANVAAFRAASGLPVNAPVMKLFGSDPGVSALDVDEASLDLEWSGAAAPGATIVYVNSTDVIAGSLTQAVDTNVAPILTISYGDCEVAFGSSNLAFYNQLLRQANVQGQTVVAASGDSGATDCDYQAKSAVSGLTVSFPASSPFVTAIGGTQFAENGGTYFTTTNGPTAGSAVSYIPEAVWNETVSGGVLSSGGGGVSVYFSKPSYQTGAGVPNDFSRDVPDVSFNSSAGNLAYLFCSQGSCTNGFRNAGGFLNPIGGTSVPTPAFGGILALLEQKIHDRVGNANLNLYSLANSSFAGEVFHDVTAGNNASVCTVGSADCPNGGSIGYSATPGYDLASGLGSINVFNLVSDWALVSPPVSGTLAPNGSVVTVSAPAGGVTAGTAVALNANVGSATQGVTATPSGSLQLLVDNLPVGGAVALAGTAATNFSVDTSNLTSGAHTVAAVYSGDTVYTGSKGVASVDVVSATLPDFLLTSSTTNVTVASGATTSGITFTVAPVNGFTGSVNFTVRNSSNNLAATPNFTVNPVVISSPTAKTTVFTLVASVPSNVPQPLSTHTTSRVVPLTFAGSGVVMAGFLLFPFARRRKRFAALVCSLFSVSMLMLSGCSSGGNSSVPVPAPVTITKATPGAYTVVISATSTNAAGVSVSHSSSLNLLVQ